jgi:demethylmenaquinone methyltransferase/2-methoxy-6-polyprenyl-1,4-benzoquinol methylase
MRPAGQPSLRSALESPKSKRIYVRRLFSVIADRYDFITVVLSYGQDRRWKRKLAAMASSHRAGRCLDLACGTGDITFALMGADRHVTGLDITPRMLELARRKPIGRGRRVAFVGGDMMALPFPDASFQIVTTGYGLRNVPELPVALHEIARVLAPGGVLLSLDFDRPANAVVRAIYLAYLTVTGSMLGLILHGEPDTYRYIPESIRRYPGAAALCRMIREAGFHSCEHRRVLGGLMAIHSAVR